MRSSIHVYYLRHSPSFIVINFILLLLSLNLNIGNYGRQNFVGGLRSVWKHQWVWALSIRHWKPKRSPIRDLEAPDDAHINDCGQSPPHPEHLNYFMAHIIITAACLRVPLHSVIIISNCYRSEHFVISMRWNTSCIINCYD